MLDEQTLFHIWNNNELTQNFSQSQKEQYKLWVERIQDVIDQFKGMGEHYITIINAYRLIANDTKYSPSHRTAQYNQAVNDIQELIIARCNQSLTKCEEVFEEIKNNKISALNTIQTFADIYEKIAYETERSNNIKIWECQLTYGNIDEIESLFALHQQSKDFLTLVKLILPNRKDLPDAAAIQILKAIERLTDPRHDMLVDLDSIINSLKLCTNANMYPDGLEQGYLTSGINFRNYKNDLSGTCPIELKASRADAEDNNE